MSSLFNPAMPKRMADMGPQSHAAPANAAEARARFFNSANAFNIKLAPVPSHSFEEQAGTALAENAATGYQLCDQSHTLGSSFAATTPLMLARYAHVAPHDALLADFAASGSIWYVITGKGHSRLTDGQILNWAAGDVFYVSGPQTMKLHADEGGATLWVVTDEPLLIGHGLQPAIRSQELVHYPADEIERQLAQIYDAEADDTTSGRALIFSSEALMESRNIHPMMTLSLNTLAPGQSQAAHRHNSAAITLIVEGDGCHSMVGGERISWQPWTTLVTPPGAPHSHHNGSSARRALFLIVQDGGLHYRARTMDFRNS
ncbi:cupin domain-containing protein [Ottowia caeni]|uniref:cupin domain-containing protein n=1 Tax=Ottowia caeni TaxID=2870339 RepID=UPI001E287EF1|nr:cupin domain-containing protein [Ottowia caeni]